LSETRGEDVGGLEEIEGHVAIADGVGEVHDRAEFARRTSKETLALLNAAGSHAQVVEGTCVLRSRLKCRQCFAQRCYAMRCLRAEEALHLLILTDNGRP
jgi:hypothetical protein